MIGVQILRRRTEIARWMAQSPGLGEGSKFRWAGERSTGLTYFLGRKNNICDTLALGSEENKELNVDLST